MGLLPLCRVRLYGFLARSPLRDGSDMRGCLCNSRPLSDFGPRERVSVSFLHAPGGAGSLVCLRGGTSCQAGLAILHHFCQRGGHSVLSRIRDPVSSRGIEWTGCAGLRLIFGSGSALRDVRDGYGCSSPGLRPQAIQNVHTGVLQSLAARAMAGSPLMPRVVVSLGKRMAGRRFFASCATVAITARQGYGS